MAADRRQNSREMPIQGAIIKGGVKPNKVYRLGRACAVCETPLSRYNKHKTCWTHTPVEKYVFRGGKRANGNGKG